MAIDLCSENLGWAASSPRISFSYDLPQTTNTTIPQRLDNSPLHDSHSSEFNFSINQENPPEDPSPADELFSDGKILPLPLKNSAMANPPLPRSNDDDSKDGRATGHKSFWQFGRSNSLNFGANRSKSKVGLICPRSKSTGSNPNSNTSLVSKPRLPGGHHLPADRRRDYRNRIRMNPVLNLPAPCFPKGRSGTGVWGFLLCSCGDKSMN